MFRSVKLSQKTKNVFFISGILGIYTYFDLKIDQYYADQNKINDLETTLFEAKLKPYHLNQIFQANEIIFKPNKKYVHLTTPFNRKIKEIYDLPFYYNDYENYNFNKLSDFFLNIHIFIN
jgi:hypothetical protein